MKHPKTAQTAGLLSVFLGWTGAPDWLSGRKKKAIIHISLAGASLVFALLGGILLQINPSARDALRMIMGQLPPSVFWGRFFAGLSYFIAAGNTIWAVAEGLITLHRGEKAFAARSAAVATSATPAASAAATTAQPHVIPVAPKPPKAPMNPATKKKLLLGGGIAAGVLVLAIIIGVVLSLVLRVDYGDTYRVASELRTKVNELYQDHSCDRAVDYTDSTWVSERTYNSYVEDCKNVVDGADDLVKKLSETSGVKRDSKISAQFKTFQEAYHEAFPDTSTIAEKLDLYQAWHTFTIKVDDLTAKSPDTDFKSAAEVLASSHNPTLSAYGEGWLEKTLAYIHAYQAYWDAPSDAANKNQLRNDMNSKQSEQRTWISENRPDMIELVGLEFNSTSKMYNSYRTLFTTIAEAYEEHYKFGSGDCTELFDDVVICD